MYCKAVPGVGLRARRDECMHVGARGIRTAGQGAILDLAAKACGGKGVKPRETIEVRNQPSLVASGTPLVLFW